LKKIKPTDPQSICS